MAQGGEYSDEFLTAALRTANDNFNEWQQRHGPLVIDNYQAKLLTIVILAFEAYVNITSEGEQSIFLNARSIPEIIELPYEQSGCNLSALGWQLVGMTNGVVYEKPCPLLIQGLFQLLLQSAGINFEVSFDQLLSTYPPQQAQALRQTIQEEEIATARAVLASPLAPPPLQGQQGQQGNMPPETLAQQQQRFLNEQALNLKLWAQDHEYSRQKFNNASSRGMKAWMNRAQAEFNGTVEPLTLEELSRPRVFNVPRRANLSGVSYAGVTPSNNAIRMAEQYQANYGAAIGAGAGAGSMTTSSSSGYTPSYESGTTTTTSSSSGYTPSYAVQTMPSAAAAAAAQTRPDYLESNARIVGLLAQRYNSLTDMVKKAQSMTTINNAQKARVIDRLSKQYAPDGGKRTMRHKKVKKQKRKTRRHA